MCVCVYMYVCVCVCMCVGVRSVMQCEALQSKNMISFVISCKFSCKVLDGSGTIGEFTGNLYFRHVGVFLAQDISNSTAYHTHHSQLGSHTHTHTLTHTPYVQVIGIILTCRYRNLKDPNANPSAFL